MNKTPLDICSAGEVAIAAAPDAETDGERLVPYARADSSIPAFRGANAGRVTRFAARLRRNVGLEWSWLIALLAIAASWWPTLLSPLVNEWFAGGTRPTVGLFQRLFDNGPFYFAAPLFGLAMIVLACRMYRHAGLPDGSTPRTTATGWGILIVSLLIQLIAVRIRLGFLSGVALLGVAAALLLIAGGWPLIRAYWLTLVTLIFMLPRPRIWTGPFFDYANQAVSAWAVKLASTASHVPMLIDDKWVYLAGKTDADPAIPLEIAGLVANHEAISIFVFYAFLFAARPGLGWIARLAMVPVTVVAVVGGTFLYALSIVWMTGLSGSKDFGVSMWLDHSLRVITLLPAFAAPLVILYGSRRLAGFPRPATVGRVAAPRHGRRRLLGPASVSLTCLLVLVGSAALCVRVAATAATERCTSRISRGLLPASLNINGAACLATWSPLPALICDTLQTDDGTQGIYTTPNARDSLLVALIISDSLRNGIHPPDLCQKGDSLFEESLSVEMADQTRIPMHGSVVSAGEQAVYCLFTYFYGSTFTTSYSRQQAFTLLSSLSRGRSHGGVLMIAVPVRRGGVDRARVQAEGVARACLPTIQKAMSRL